MIPVGNQNHESARSISSCTNPGQRLNWQQGNKNCSFYSFIYHPLPYYSFWINMNMRHGKRVWNENIHDNCFCFVSISVWLCVFYILSFSPLSLSLCIHLLLNAILHLRRRSYTHSNNATKSFNVGVDPSHIWSAVCNPYSTKIYNIQFASTLSNTALRESCWMHEREPRNRGTLNRNQLFWR